MTASSPAMGSRTGLAPLVQFGDAILRGVGQVMFQNNPLTGALFLLAILVNSFVAGADLVAQGVSPFMLFGGALLGTVVSTLTAMLLGADRGLVSAGLFGFNGTLVGIALPFFFQTDALLVLLLILAAACSTVVMAALLNALGQWEVPALTAPFVITTWFFLAAMGGFAALRPTAFLAPPALQAQPGAFTGLGLDAIWQGALMGAGEVMFQLHWVAGAIFLVGILVNSRISFAFAILGSLIGLGVASLMGAPAGMIGAGLHGFNPVLTGIALGGFFYVLTWKSALYAVFAMVITTVVMAAMVTMLAPAGLPALTWPFIVTTWLFIFAKAMFGQLRAVAPARATTPEGNLRAAE
ncbi:MAG TPA: urea transporter [Chloroflexaceae bacterium]|nr:urea transporter [Chloroflexaceae bacterium]